MNKTAIGIDFGGTTVKSGVMREGKLLARLPPLQTHDHTGHDSLLAAIRAAIEELRRQFPDVAAVGAGLPGMVDSINGRVWQLSNVPGWEDVALTALLEEWTGLPAAIDNDANAMAYAEWLFGAGREGVNVVCVTLGTGVGGGLILDRRLYRGSRLGAGEIGQMTIDPNGPSGAVRQLWCAREVCRQRPDRGARAGALPGSGRDENARGVFAARAGKGGQRGRHGGGEGVGGGGLRHLGSRFATLSGS